MSRLSSDALSNKLMVLDSPMTEIQPKNIHARSNQAPDHVFAVAPRPNCGDNFCSSVHAGCVF
jgi:hypothetical protein